MLYKNVHRKLNFESPESLLGITTYYRMPVTGHYPSVFIIRDILFINFIMEPQSHLNKNEAGFLVV